MPPDEGYTIEHLLPDEVPFIPDEKPNGHAAPKAQASEPARLFDPWERYPVPDFPLEVLPPVVRDFVRSQGELIGGDPSAIAMAALVAISGALSHEFGLRMMSTGKWWASPRLWVLLCGDPSRKKTPIINAATRQLEKIQGELFKHWLRAVNAQEEDEDEPERPPRYVVNDTTVEKLGDILSRQGRSLLVKRDEISGWIGSMERYTGRGSAASDRSFWLKAYDGGGYHIDRVNRGETYIKNLSVSMIGGVQPARLAELRNLTTDGLLQRFLPIMVKAPRFPVDDISTKSDFEDDKFSRLIRRMTIAQPHNLILDNAGLVAMMKLRQRVFDIEQVGGGLAEGFQGFAGKLPEVAGSLSLVLHMAAHPEQIGTHVRPSVVEAVSQILLDFILPHAFEFYRTTETVTSGDRLQKIASHILTSGKTRFTPSDLTTNVWCLRGLGTADLIAHLSPLVASGWLVPQGTELHPIAWHLPPQVPAQFAERAAEEERQKAELARLISSPRRKKGGID